MVNDTALRKLCGLSSLKSLNLDVGQVTDSGLETLASMWSNNPMQITLQRMFFILFSVMYQILNVYHLRFKIDHYFPL